jgi:uncharacterized protein with PIN domain
MLGALARRLRMFGFDAEYAAVTDLQRLVQQAKYEKRWFLSRRRVRSPEDLQMIVIASDCPHQQLLQVLKAVPEIPTPDEWFSRCLRCNRPLEVLGVEEVRHRVPDYVARTHAVFRICPSCERIYWPGTHAGHMRSNMEQWLKETSPAQKLQL